LLARLQQGPGPEAQQQIEPTPTGPPPSRWTLSGIRATFAWLDGYTLSGVWRLLRRAGLRLRGAAIQQYSPDPEYRDKLERLLACLQEAAQHRGEVVVVFLDEMGFTRWPEAARD